MKLFLAVFIVACSQLAFAQRVEVVQGNQAIRGTNGLDAKTVINGVTDTQIYDMDGNVIDTATAHKLLRTWEYESAFAIPQGQTSLKRVVKKLDPVKDAETERYVKMLNRPQSNKLWEGVTLDLNPLSKRIDLEKVKDKAVVLIFWLPQPAKDLYGQVNEVIAQHIGSNKFEVFAITHEPGYVARPALKKNPILNAQQIYDAESIVNYYGADKRPLIVVTNAQHQITYALTAYAPITPRVMNRLFKAL